MNYEQFDRPNKPKYDNLNQFSLLSWKNLKLQKRSIISTILEIAVPALFAIILILIRRIVKSDQYLNDTLFPAFSVNALPETLGLSCFGYFPNNSILLTNIMKIVSKELTLDLYCKQ